MLIGRLNRGALEYKSANACIQFLAALDAKHVVTIEALANGAFAKPLQDAMVRHHGSQCGFCTPGIMMSLFALFMNDINPSIEAVEIALQGNLCRCTGYEPIVKAARSIAGDETCIKWFEQQRSTITEKLQCLSHGETIELSHQDHEIFVPQNHRWLNALSSKKASSNNYCWRNRCWPMGGKAYERNHASYFC